VGGAEGVELSERHCEDDDEQGHAITRSCEPIERHTKSLIEQSRCIFILEHPGRHPNIKGHFAKVVEHGATSASTFGTSEIEITP
jgi:hypothetical protein